MGFKIYLNSLAKTYKKNNDEITVQIDTPNGQIDVNVDHILVSVGRSPNTIGLENSGIKLDNKGFIKVDKSLMTNIPKIYAIGDVRGPPFLAHKASHDGLKVAEEISGLKINHEEFVPEAIYTEPEIASVGLSYQKAKNLGYEIMVGQFPFAALGRAKSENEIEGFVKVIGDKESGKLLGIQIVGAKASELIGEATIAIKLGAKVQDLYNTIHPHPTFSESISEAAGNALGKAINILNSK
jgi:dihydrolipoamide dehydrogenase